MMLIVCTHCRLALRVIGDQGEIESLIGRMSELAQLGYPCAGCGRQTEAIRETEADPEALSRMKVVDATPHEAFAAVYGLGLPSERACEPAVIDELLRTHRIVGVKLRPVPGSRRCCIDELTLEDGTRMFLGASSQGALVYRIVNRSSYAERVTDE